MMRNTLLIAILACCLLTTGCQETAKPDGQVFDRFYVTSLKLSKSADILPIIAADTELTSQSESIIASWDQQKDNAVLWFNMVAFDEEQLTAVRKYAFLVDEKEPEFLSAPTQRIRFDASIVLSEDILTEPFANDNEKKIAVIGQIQKSFSGDTAKLTTDSSSFTSASMMTKQIFNHILYKLDKSPALAAELSDLSGMEFDHMTLGTGRVRLVVEDDIASFKVKIGTIAKGFEAQDDVMAM